MWWVMLQMPEAVRGRVIEVHWVMFFLLKSILNVVFHGSLPYPPIIYTSEAFT
jgi:hypothetical protein